MSFGSLFGDDFKKAMSEGPHKLHDEFINGADYDSGKLEEIERELYNIGHTLCYLLYYMIKEEKLTKAEAISILTRTPKDEVKPDMTLADYKGIQK